MEPARTHRDGVLVIGAWIDVDTNEFRARVMQTTESDAHDPNVIYVASPTEIVDLVQDWLTDFAPSIDH